MLLLEWLNSNIKHEKEVFTNLGEDAGVHNILGQHIFRKYEIPAVY